MNTDVLVVGGGINGLWTAYHLCRSGSNVIVLEQFTYPHTRGSSHGQSRIIRHGYIKTHHAEMMPESFLMWHQLEKESSTKLYQKTNLVNIFESGDESFLAMRDNMRKLNVAYEVFDEKKTNQKFSGLNINNRSVILYEPESGILLADKCCKMLQEEILKKGGKILDGKKVLSVKPITKDKVVLKTSDSVYYANSVVITCGAWTNKILKDMDLQLPLTPTRVFVTYWKEKTDKNKYSYERFPEIIYYGKDHFYSLPSFEYPGLMKVCLHDGVACDPDSRDSATGETSLKQDKLLKNIVHKYFPDLENKPSITEICIYTTTPDSDYIVDYHPNFPNVVFAAGFSGSGFKTSPVIGKILCNMVQKRKVPHYCNKMKMSRFVNKASL